jgi:hypothetical protein
MFRGEAKDFHPWWWPVGVGRNPEDYLTAHLMVGDVERSAGVSFTELVSSLQGGMAPRPASSLDTLYTGFSGFWGTEVIGGAQVVFVSLRPSTATYPTRHTDNLMRVLSKLCIRNAHFTDFIKRRGKAGSLDLPKGDSLTKHGELLIEEVTIISSTVAQRVRLVPVHKDTLMLLKSQSIRERLEERIGKGVTVPDEFAPYWSPRNGQIDTVIEKWKAIVGRCGE